MSKYNIKPSLLFLTFIILANIISCGKDTQNNTPSPSTPTAAPTITNFSPASGIAGDVVVITGTNFSSSGSGNIVKFNGVIATVTNVSATQLTVMVPVGATTGNITLTVNNQTVISNLPFIIWAPPIITSFSPSNGRPNDQVIITGTNFSINASNNIVKFNGSIATITNASLTQLTVKVPPSATSGPISVTSNGQTVISASTFTVFESQVTTFAGSGIAGFQDGTGILAMFSHPEGIAKDAAGNLYVADEYNRAIRKITPSGIVSTITTISNSSSVPTGIAVDLQGNIYVADRNINLIWKISPSGVVNNLAGAGLQGYMDGQGAAAKFNLPTDVAVDASGNVFVADVGNRRIRKITPSGMVSTFAGSDTAQTYDGIGVNCTFISPRGIAIDAAGNLYVSDYEKIRKITPGAVVTTIAGSSGAGYMDGPVFSAKFFNPKGLTIDASGNILIAEKTRIRKITTDGFVITIAGTGNYGFADGPGSSAQFDAADGIVVDPSGNVFIADNSNNRIRKISF